MSSSRIRSESGFTLIELVLALFLTSLLALGVSKMFGASVTSMTYNSTTSVTGANTATLNALVTHDIEESNGFIVPSSAGVYAITAASGDGTYMTYTYTGPQTLVIGQSVSVTGMPAGYSALNATIATVPSAGTFTVLSTQSGAATLSGNGALFANCTTWSSADTTFANVRPLLTLSQIKSTTISAASGDGTTSTYTYTGQDIFQTGQSVTISGISALVGGVSVNSSLNVTNAVITGVNSNANTFSIANISADTGTTAGVATFNQFVGYEVHTNASGKGELWRVQCLKPQLAVTGPTSKMLRTSLPVASSASWTGSIVCSIFSAGNVSSATCPADTFLSDTTLYPALTMTIPATSAVVDSGGSIQYPSQVILGARSIS
ncbi:MAG: prepilin-type N-terminal cleavage/methylation domain-containing protein [Actinomycetes bacterium]